MHIFTYNAYTPLDVSYLGITFEHNSYRYINITATTFLQYLYFLYFFTFIFGNTDTTIMLALNEFISLGKTYTEIFLQFRYFTLVSLIIYTGI